MAQNPDHLTTLLKTIHAGRQPVRDSFDGRITLMQFLYSLFGTPLGWIFKFLYGFIGNFGITLILFTLLYKLVMFPLGISQQKMTAKMARVNPKLKELQQKYKNQPQKLQEEQMALYERENIKMSAGCLPSLLQFLILFGIIDVVYKPLTHVLSLSSEVISQATEILAGLGSANAAGMYAELSVVNMIHSNADAFSALGSDVIAQIQSLDMNFLFWDLAETPTLAFNALLFIPLFSFGTAMLMSVLMLHQQKDNPGAQNMKTMMLLMPLLSLWIAFSVPAGVGLYWGVSNLFSLIQQQILYKMYNPQKMAAEAEAREKLEKEAAKKARSEKVIVVDADGTQREVERQVSEKEANRRRLAEARRRDAEKYGETYVEVEDKDLE